MTEPKAFTERELEIMGMAWLCFAEQPKPDYDKLAGLCGFTNPKSASNAWSNIKKKLTQMAEISTGDGDDEGGTASTNTTSKATPRKRGKKTADEGESPTKKIKGRKGKAKSVAPKDSSDDEIGENKDDVKAVVKEEQEDGNSEEDGI